jgi:DNA invertase Pin-like site-specific DNA recombinase
MPEEKKRVAIYIREIAELDILSVINKLRNYILEKNWDISGEYLETFFAKTAKPDGLAVLLSESKEKNTQAIIIYRLDQLGNTVTEARKNLQQIREGGLDLLSWADGISSIDQGNLVFILFEKVLAAIKNLESRERQAGIKAGLEKAKIQGKKLGRPVVPDKLIKKAVELRSQNFSFREIGRLLDLDESTIRKKLKK